MRASTWFVLSLLAPALGVGAQQPRTVTFPETSAAGARAITVQDLRAWLGRLASPEFEGRGTGQPGFEKAARFVREHFESLGLKSVLEDGGYWQRVPWTVQTPDLERSHLTVEAGSRELCRLIPGRGLHGTGAQVDASGPAVLLILSEPDVPGVAELDLKGKFVLAWAPDGFADARRMLLATFRLRSALRRAGAVGFVIADDDAVARYPHLSGASYPSAGGRARRGRSMMPAMLYVPERALADVLAGVGKRLEDLDRNELALDLAPARVRVRIEMLERDASAYNVMAALPGSDPELTGEYVVIGAHLDHLGRRGATIYPGADDDGSGSAAVMAVAKAFAVNPVRPRRSILFVTFCGEENGLIGSAYFVRHPPIPLESIAAELQMDMIGRDEEGRGERAEDNRNTLHLIGTAKLSDDLHRACLRGNERYGGFELEWDEEDVFYRSDHWSFAQYGVPIAFFFTGFHRDYHRPTDTPDKIHYAKLARIARMVYGIAFDLAMNDSRPLVDPERWEKLRRRRGTRPKAPLRTR